ncbi:MAG: LysR substrate-binding domain-containing protein [Chitinophagales bacterium]|jgi:LysR family hydrogen peroxide-inducible transcriptional activator|nr:LysR substrate-binding domain-containing protein [Chitinophagales bacterium]
MNLSQLEYLIALETHKSFSKAAKACFVTQATMSTMIKRLEEELGVEVFDRRRNPIELTDIGREILNETKTILFHAENLKTIADSAQKEIKGNLRIGIIPTIASNLLHRIYPLLHEKHPLLKLEFKEITTATILDRIRMNQIDIGIVATPLELDDIEDEILYYEELLVYGAPKAENFFYSLGELSQSKLWLLEEGNCLSDQIMNVCALKSKKKDIENSFQPNSFDSLINIVDAMNGLTVIPELYYLDLHPERKAKVSQFVKPHPVREISIIYHKTYAKRKLIDVLALEIKSLIKPQLSSRLYKNNEMLIAPI